MRIVIAGTGDVGAHLAEIFSKQLHDIVVIDLNEEKLKTIDAHFDVLTINGSACSFETLNNANAAEADLFIAVTNSEEVNINATIIAKKLGAGKTIARIDNGEYLSADNGDMLASLGVDKVLCPEKLASDEIVSLLKRSGTSEVYEFAGGQLSFVVIKIDELAEVAYKTLIEVDKINKNVDYRIVAITRNSKTIIPRGYDVLLPNDLVYVITNQTGIEEILMYTGKEKFDINNIMILGGSRIGVNTALDLQDQLNVKIIEPDKERSFKLADKLTNTLIIQGDNSDIDMLQEEGVSKMDAFIALTGNSETNILSCLFAKKQGVRKTIAEIENRDYIEIAEEIGIDTIINKKIIAASYISSLTKSDENTSVKQLVGTDAEVFELTAKRGASITQSQLNEIDFPKDAIIGGLIRGDDEVIIAKGTTRVKENDKVIVFALPAAINKVERYFI